MVEIRTQGLVSLARLFSSSESATKGMLISNCLTEATLNNRIEPMYVRGIVFV